MYNVGGSANWSNINDTSLVCELSQRSCEGELARSFLHVPLSELGRRKRASAKNVGPTRTELGRAIAKHERTPKSVIVNLDV
jgi:hypothetical protein